MLELCTDLILEQKEKIELIWYFYTHLLESDWFSDFTLFGNIPLFGNADVSRNTHYDHNHYLVSFFTNFIQALHAYRAKGKVNISKMAEASHPNVST